MKLKEIYSIALKFRKALEQLHSEQVIKRFPNGYCGTASDLFIYYMADEYQIMSDSWLGYFPDSNSHAWVKIGKICIDLTADQFNKDNVFYDTTIVCTEENYPLISKLSIQEKGIGPLKDSSMCIDMQIYNAIKKLMHSKK